MKTNNSIDKNSICMICNSIHVPGGISHQVNLLNTNLSKQGFKVKITETKKNKKINLLIFIDLLRNKNSKVFHIHGCSNWGGFYPIIIGSIVGKVLGKTIIVTYHGGDAEEFVGKNLTICKWIFKLADKITVPSNYLHNVFTNLGIDTIVIPNMIGLKLFNFEDHKHMEPHFLVVKHLTDNYNIKMAIDAFKLTKKQYPKATLTIVGGGPLENQLKSQVITEKIKNIKFVGQIAPNLVSKKYRDASIFLHTSKKESFGIVILVSFASGLPVISTNVGGISDIIVHKKNGYLVESEDHISMAKHMIYLLKNPRTFELLRKNARKDCAKFTWLKIKNKWLNLYSSK